MKPLIIERPESQSVTQRWGFGLLTLLFWGLFAYFLRPLATMAVWALSYWRFHDVMIEGQGMSHLSRLLLIYILIIAGMGIILIGWGMYNLFRYGHNEKRTNPPLPATPEMLAEDFKVDPNDVRTWQSKRNLTLYFDSSGQITEAQYSSDKPESS